MSNEIERVFATYVKPRVKKDAITIEDFRNGVLYLNVHHKIKDINFLKAVEDIFLKLVPEVTEVRRADYKSLIPEQKIELPTIDFFIEAEDDWK